MTDRPAGFEFSVLLRQRLEAVRGALGGAAKDAGTAPPAQDSALLVEVARLVRTLDDSASAWLLFSAVAGCYARPDEVRDLRRRLELSRSDTEAAHEVLVATRSAAEKRGVWDKPVRVVSDAIVVDVSFCAQTEHNTGIQRLVRESMSSWETSGHTVEFVAWDHNMITRTLYHEELDRVLHWSNPDRTRDESVHSGEVELLIPYRSTLFVVEVPHLSVCEPLEAIAQYSNNKVVAIGYDAIPLVSADLVPAEESERFGRYLSFLKYTDAILGISAAASNEFRGFADAVRAQGLPGPAVTEVSLPVALPEGDLGHVATTGVPLVLCVGSHEPRKNQEGVLHAAQLLWREGVDFRLVFVGRGDASLTTPFDKRLKGLRRAGRAVEARRSVSDQELSGLYHSAEVTMFPSLHEGYGLPVAESLAAGTPVITTSYGSTAEIGAEGGCVLVDPRDDASLLAALRRVLTDAKYSQELQEKITTRDHRSWSDYANELWAALNDGTAA